MFHDQLIILVSHMSQNCIKHINIEIKARKMGQRVPSSSPHCAPLVVSKICSGMASTTGICAQNTNFFPS
jgi:hypothetical protein